MSWGSTAFTPIITHNTPPFGFHERQNPSDFATCPDDPYVGAENLKEDIKELYRTKEGFHTYPVKCTGTPECKCQNCASGLSFSIVTIVNIPVILLMIVLLYYLYNRI